MQFLSSAVEPTTDWQNNMLATMGFSCNVIKRTIKRCNTLNDDDDDDDDVKVMSKIKPRFNVRMEYCDWLMNNRNN